MDLIHIRDAEKLYTLEKTRIRALERINLEIRSGERVCLMGPSGQREVDASEHHWLR